MNRATVSREEWTAARRQLLDREKELTKLQEEVNRQRSELPWVKVEERNTYSIRRKADRRWAICSRGAAS